MTDATERELRAGRLAITGLTYDRDRLAEDVRSLRAMLETAERHRDEYARLWHRDAARKKAYEEALREIAKGEGRFSRDLLTHASNTIEDMKALAVAAIQTTKEEGT